MSSIEISRKCEKCCKFNENFPFSNFLNAFSQLQKGNYETALFLMKESGTIEKSVLNLDNISYSWGDFCAGCTCGLLSGDTLENIISCCSGNCFLSICSLIFGAACCTAVMENMGMEGSICWNFCGAIQDGTCNCLESCIEGVFTCVCGCKSCEL